MLKYFKNIAILTVIILGLGLGTCFATVVYDTSGDVVSDSSNDPVSDSNGPALVAPMITTQPVDVTVVPNATATFSVVAVGIPIPNYQWLQEAPGASSFSPIIGAISASYTTPATTTANSWTEYECVVSSVLGKVTSSVATLFVNTPPSIVTQPVSVSVVSAETATFTVLATGVPVPSYQWQQKLPGANSFTTISGATSYFYTTPATTIANSGTQYVCLVSNGSGSIISNPATLTVTAAIAPNIVTQPSNLTVVAPASASFAVVASGSPSPTYQWESISGGVVTPISGAISANYRLAITSTTNNGTQFECVVTNSAGSVTSTPATLTVNATGAPIITVQPISVTTTAGVTATFSVAATGTPAPTYQWYNSIGGGAFTIMTGQTSPTRTTGVLTTANSGNKYECVVTNAAGSVTSNVATLTVNPVPAGEIIANTNTSKVTITGTWLTSTTIGGYYGTNYIDDGDTLEGTKSVKYTPSLTGGTGSYQVYMWYTASSNRASNVPVDIIHSGVTTTVTVNEQANGGEWVLLGTYNFLANGSGEGVNIRTTSANGYVIANAVDFVQVTSLPIITTQPTNASVIASATATFTVTATGTPSPTYQWMQSLNGGAFTPISGATAASYTTGQTTVNNNGAQYECVVGNSVGSVTSNAATLTVKAITTYIQKIIYNVNGQITQIQYGNGTTTTYTYNPLNFRIMRIHTSNAQDQVIQDLNYTYDSVGQVLSIVDNVNTGAASMNQNFAYDALNRLTAASGAYGNKTYAYDAIGNIAQKDGLAYYYGEANSQVNSAGTPIGNAGPHAVTSLSDGSTFKYDANGNMVTLQKASNLTQYAYDSQNRLQSVTVGGLQAASYAYDGDGGRTIKTVYRRDLALYNNNTNPLLFGSIDNPLPATAQNPSVDTTVDVGNVYEIESATGLLRQTKFIYLGSTRVASVDSAGNVFYYHTDHLGGTNVLTDATGAVREVTTYDPFGLVFSHEKYGNNFATAWYYFTGKPLDDETGLIFLGARYYNPSLGRFITPDSIVQAPKNPQTLNRYTYCNNNPVNLVDPDGHSWWSKLWKSITKVFESFVKAVVEAVVYTVLSPIITPIGAGLLVGFVAGGLGNGGGWSWSGALEGGVLGAIGGAAFGTNGVNGFLGSAGQIVGLGLMAAGGVYAGVTGGFQGVLNYGASIAGGMVGVGIGRQINLKIADLMSPDTGTAQPNDNVKNALANSQRPAINSAGVPSKFVIAGSQNMGSYSIYSYQLEDANGTPLTGSGYSVEENVIPSGGNNSNGEFVPMENGVAHDTVGWSSYADVPANADIKVDQTFVVQYNGNNYNLSTEFQHEHISINGDVINTVSVVKS